MAGTFSQSSVLNSSHSVHTTTAWEPGQLFDKLHTRVTETISNREGDITVMGTFRGGVGVGAAGDQILHLVHIIHILVGLEQQTLQSLLSRDNRQERKTLENISSGNSKLIQKLEKRVSRIPGKSKGKHLTRSHLEVPIQSSKFSPPVLVGQPWRAPQSPAPWLPNKMTMTMMTMTMMNCSLVTYQDDHDDHDDHDHDDDLLLGYLPR